MVGPQAVVRAALLSAQLQLPLQSVMHHQCPITVQHAVPLLMHVSRAMCTCCLRLAEAACLAAAASGPK